MGDGVYPVYALISDEGEWGKRVAGVFIDCELGVDFEEMFELYNCK